MAGLRGLAGFFSLRQRCFRKGSALPGRSLPALGLLLLLAAATLAGQATAAREAPAVVLVESPVAERWLGQAGIPFTRRSEGSLAIQPLSGASVAIIPMEAVTTAAAAQNIRTFLANGGKVVALYWGTLQDGPPGTEPTGPCYQLAEGLGVKPTAWAPGPTAGFRILEPGSGALPSGDLPVRLPECPMVSVEPAHGGRAVAAWSNQVGPVEPAEKGTPGPAAAVLRGRSLYLGVNLLRPATACRETRELLFWAIQRVAPEQGAEWQARDRIAAAGRALNAMNSGGPELLGHPELETVRSMLTEARALLARNSPVGATLAADRARAAAEAFLDRQQLRIPRD